MIYDKIVIDLRTKVDENDNQLFPELIHFWAVPALEKLWRKRMTERLGMTEAQKEETEFQFNVDLILALAAKEPKGIPGLEGGENWKENLTNYFGERNDTTQLLAKHLSDAHINQTGSYSFRS